MPNNRVFYANHGVAVNDTTVQGAQSVSVNTNFNIEQVFQLGRLAIYDTVQVDPEVEITINKALDGHPLIYSLAAVSGDSLIEMSKDKSSITLTVGDDTKKCLTDIGCNIEMTGAYLSSLNYTFPVDGNFTEEVTFIGTHKGAGGVVAAPDPEPDANGAGGNKIVLRRQNFSNGSTIPGLVTGAGNLSQITISADLGREAIYRLGQFAPYERVVNFPIEITVSFDVIATCTDGVLVEGVDEDANCSTPELPSDETIKIQLCEEGGGIVYCFDLGTRCSLQSTSYSGGDTGGGNVTITYTYVSYNELAITTGDCSGEFEDPNACD